MSALVFALALSAEASVWDYSGHVTFSAAGMSGRSETVENVPVLLRIREEMVRGFGYELLHSGTNGLAFFDTKGESLNYEIESWNPAGESLIWVNVPTLNSGTQVTMCWDLRDGCQKPARNDPTAVWSDYVGVWHMSASGDSSPTQASGAFGAVSAACADGVFGTARGAKVTGANGALLVAEATDALAGLNVTGFTASFYIRLNDFNADWAYLFSRKENDAHTGWGVQFSGASKGDASGLRMYYSTTGQWYTRTISGLEETNAWHRMDVAMLPNWRAVWVDGVKRIEITDTTTFGTTGTGFSIGGLAGDGHGTLNGDIDEFRLSAGTNILDDARAAIELAQTNDQFCVAVAFTNDASAVLQNEWVREPSITQSVWEEGTYPTRDDFSIEPLHGTNVTVVVVDRSTGAVVASNEFSKIVFPRTYGSYRVLISVAQSGTAEEGVWGALEYTLGYRIAEHAGSHEFAVNVARILLANDDYTVSGGEVEWQSYDDEDADFGYPYWRHLDADGNDASTTYDEYWSDSYEFNLGGGTHHIYRYGGGVDRLWDLRDIRIGNTYNNGEEIWERKGRNEVYAEGLAANQNYLPWNPDSQRVYGSGKTVEGYHRYVGNIVMQNSTNAAVTSTCFTNGIGTLYFDAVNGWTDNITNANGEANYRLVVEVATASVLDPALPPTERYISSAASASLDIAEADAAAEPFYWGNWTRWENLHVLRFRGDRCDDLGTTNAVDLKIADGGSYKCFYRVVVPMNLMPKTGGVRIRIRRETLDPEQSLAPDGTAYILLDNIICSEQPACVQLTPYGQYFTEKVRQNGDIVMGWEGAFDPAFPSVSDAQISGRARATMPDGSPIPDDVLTSATMHYRWHYLEQKTTEWMEADLDLATLRTREPLQVPALQGDIDFWFDAVQHGHYYIYADYSGTDFGLGGFAYSEEIPAVTNRAEGADWFVRMREGKSDFAELKLLVKASEAGAVRETSLSVVKDNLWRGYYRMTNAAENVIYWRIEARNRQTNGDTVWNWSTNRWYVTDWTAEPPTYPAAGRLSEGATNSWSRMTCDMQTGYLMFQVDETSLGVTAIHADYQAFDRWNDAGKGYFTGSSTEMKDRSGTSSEVREYTMDYASWSDTPATNAAWRLDLSRYTIGETNFPGYKTFANFNNYFPAWQIGKGMWVYGKYREPSSHVALQMAGGTEGYAEFSNDTMLGDNWPRGLESISFHSRLAQDAALKYAAFYTGGEEKGLTNYTFMTRVCFDQKDNWGFCGSASMSLFSYYTETKGAYEARWEQIAGEMTTGDYAGVAMGPKKAGQRLVISRWNKKNTNYVRTELIATTNYAFSSWNFYMPTIASTSATNNLMPFLLSTYHTADATYVIAAVRVRQKTDANTGVGPDATVPNDSYWYCVTYKDESSSRLKRGRYGVLASNCEGLFVTPQFNTNPVWPTTVHSKTTTDRTAVTTWNQCAQQALNNYVYGAFASCVDDMVFDEDGYSSWSVSRDYPGRVATFYDEEHPTLGNYGFSYVVERQTVDVLAKSRSSSEAWDADKHRIGTVLIDDFGRPGPDPDHRAMFYYTSDSVVRLQTGGTLDDEYPTDVVIDDIEVRQWRGYDCSKSTGQDTYYDHTNFIFTCGWITNGAVQLSAKRTAVGSACSLRSPMLDGDYGNGVGVGGFRFSYREPQTNINLLVQIATNLQNGSSDLKALTYSVTDKRWVTVTNLYYRDLWPVGTAAGATNTYSVSFGYHGTKGLMRILVDPQLVQEVSDLNMKDTTAFGAIDITAVKCFDEPALDKGCWWGWNLQIIGDATDSQKRMYLPDGTWNIHYGQSLALNNSVSADIDPDEERENFWKHMPFLQSPTFTNAVIGQVSFKARRYEISDYAPDAQVVVYGATKNPDSLADDKDWTYIAAFPITNTLYMTYTCKTDSQNFYALRLAVVDVPGTPERPRDPRWTTTPQRVLLDEVSISEAVRAMLAFRNVGAFRSELKSNVYVEGVTTSKEQPLCNENWGVQAEVFATMLGDEIDKDYTPRVKLHWYVGTDLWGYENWKNRETGSAWLAQTEGSNYVYRSSYDAAPAAIMPAQPTNTVVQYMLEVEYRRIASPLPGETPKAAMATNWLDDVAWTTPSWYAPVDYNTDPAYGAGKTFAAFTILDTVAPGWAWLNEANVYGTEDTMGKNSDQQFQYVEVCVPMEADITGWKLRMLEAGVYDNTVTTNEIATFGSGRWDQAAGMKKDNLGAKYKKVFRCLGNKESGQLKTENGTLDGIWQFSAYTSTFRSVDDVDCVYDVEMPFGVQLVRPTGIIESSIVVVGTNRWGRLPGYRDYDPTNIVAKLNQNMPGSKFFYAAEDCCGTFRSGSVTSGQGESASVWTNDWACSPGYINTNWGGKVEQKIADHPTPHGDSIIIYASVDLSGGPIRQWVGGRGSTQTNASEIVILQKDSVCGTNIVYQVEPWYEIAGITTNGAVFWYEPRVREHQITVGVGASNNITVVAKAGVDSDLRDRYGLTEANPFTPAVLAWLRGGKDAYGNTFAHDGEIALADYWDMANVCITNLSLTQMYCFDMDPTVSNLLLKAGMINAWPVVDPASVDWPIAEQDDGTHYLGHSGQTNVRIRVFMMISNKVEAVAGPGGEPRRAWAPYILRGLDADYTSWDYRGGGAIAQDWTSETFKVTGILANGKTRESNEADWKPLRWFVFHEGSFADDYTANIEIDDPHSPSSQGAAYEWYQYPTTPIFTRWAIDMRSKPVEVEILQPTNYFSSATTP